MLYSDVTQCSSLCACQVLRCGEVFVFIIYYSIPLISLNSILPQTLNSLKCHSWISFHHSCSGILVDLLTNFGRFTNHSKILRLLSLILFPADFGIFCTSMFLYLRFDEKIMNSQTPVFKSAALEIPLLFQDSTHVKTVRTLLRLIALTADIMLNCHVRAECCWLHELLW